MIIYDGDGNVVDDKDGDNDDGDRYLIQRCDGKEWGYEKHHDKDDDDDCIPHICHFFYTDRIFENQILHPKKRLKSPKTLKMSLKK